MNAKKGQLIPHQGNGVVAVRWHHEQPHHHQWLAKIQTAHDNVPLFLLRPKTRDRYLFTQMIVNYLVEPRHKKRARTVFYLKPLHVIRTPRRGRVAKNLFYYTPPVLKESTEGLLITASFISHYPPAATDNPRET